MGNEKAKEPEGKPKGGAAYDSWKTTDPAKAGAGAAADKRTLKAKLSKMVDRFIRKFNTDKGWYDE